MKGVLPNWSDIVNSIRIRKARITYLHHRALWDLAQATRMVEKQGIPGVILEAGTALGGSAIMMALAKSTDRPLKVYDVFSMIPEPTDADGEDVHARYQSILAGASEGIQGDLYYGYQADLKRKVEENFERFNRPLARHHVELIEGLFEDTLVGLDVPVALAHVDGDWYQSVMTCLEAIAPRLSIGGRMVFDDYDAWSGCRTAIDQYFQGKESSFRMERHKRLHVVRIR